jgi:RHS repeat-associated protein
MGCLKLSYGEKKYTGLKVVYSNAYENENNCTGAYRYGFNGKENDNEVKGTGNQQDYGLRIYDPRLGRFLSVDPLFRDFAWNSTYAFAEDSPIENLDLDGGEKRTYLISLNKSTVVGVVDYTSLKKGYGPMGDGIKVIIIDKKGKSEVLFVKSDNWKDVFRKKNIGSLDKKIIKNEVKTAENKIEIKKGQKELEDEYEADKQMEDAIGEAETDSPSNTTQAAIAIFNSVKRNLHAKDVGLKETKLTSENKKLDNETTAAKKEKEKNPNKNKVEDSDKPKPVNP